MNSVRMMGWVQLQYPCKAKGFCQSEYKYSTSLPTVCPSQHIDMYRLVHARTHTHIYIYLSLDWLWYMRSLDQMRSVYWVWGFLCFWLLIVLMCSKKTCQETNLSLNYLHKKTIPKMKTKAVYLRVACAFQSFFKLTDPVCTIAFFIF